MSTLTVPGRNSPWRDRSIEENLDLFARMRAGEFPNGARVLRARPQELARSPASIHGAVADDQNRCLKVAGLLLVLRRAIGDPGEVSRRGEDDGKPLLRLQPAGELAS